MSEERGSGLGAGGSGERQLPLAPDSDDARAGVSRRDVLRLLGAAPFAVSLGWSPAGLERAARYVEDVQPRAPKFFTPREWKTVRLLADYVIPRDATSGSATDAKAPEFVDFMLADRETTEASRMAMRGGLAWLDLECRRRFARTFVGAGDAQRRQVLDDIAWPKKARPEMSQGVAFFNRFRDAVASGFYSSAMGWKDLRYVSNVANPEWRGCPAPALAKLGVSYEAYEASLAERRRRTASQE